MRIVIAMEGEWSDHFKTFDLIKTLSHCCGDSELIIALNGISSEFIDPLRERIANILPQNNIRLWHTPRGLECDGEQDTSWPEKVAELIVAGFLESLNPDIVIIAKVGGKGSSELVGAIDLMGTGIPIVFLLPESPFEDYIRLIGTIHLTCIEKKYQENYLTYTELSRHEWIKRLGVEEQFVVAFAETSDESLERQAQIIFDACQTWHKNKVASSLQVHKSENCPKLAYISPLPPERSGISDYSAELLPELSHFYEIDVVVEQEYISNSWICENCIVRSVTWFREHFWNYDRVLYHFGNSHYHHHMFALLAEVPGVVVLHDFFLSNFLEYRDRSTNMFADTLFRSHGYPALQQLFSSENGRSDSVVTYPCNFDILTQAEGIIFHSEYAKRLSVAWYSALDTKHSEIVPLLRSSAHAFDRTEARQALGFRINDIVVCSFGMPGLYKLSHILLEAWLASSLAENEQCFLIFVGDVPDDDFERNLKQTIENNEHGKRIRMTGWVPIEEYRLYLASSDIGVQLRTSSRGESSASALDCMNYGLATIVNANGSLGEIPRDCVMMLPDVVTVNDLKVAMETLCADASLRQQLGNNARGFVMSDRAPSRIAEAYAAAIERFSHSPTAIRHTIERQIVHDKTIPDDEDTFGSIVKALGRTFHRPMQRQLLIDVSALVLVDLKTGIQRVVRSIVKALIDNPPDGFRIEPVYATPDTPYRYARKFTLDLLGFFADVVTDDVVEIQANDILFVPDLHFQVVHHQREYFSKIRNEGASVFFLVHDILPIKHPEYFPDGTLGEFQKWLNVVVQTDGAICVSRAVAEDLHNWLNQVQPERFRTFAIGWNHHGADIASSIPSKGLPDGFVETLNAFASAPTILMVGTVEPRKGHLQVLRAFEKLWMAGVKVNLVIVGKKGWMVDEITTLMERHSNSNQQFVWYQGISDEALQQLYEVADGVLMASYGEGFGLPLIEAAQYGCPILARDLPVFREVAGKYATYFSDTSAGKLSITLKSWISKLDKGMVPQSSKMSWLSWTESAEGIVKLLTNNQNSQWIFHWEKTRKSKQTVSLHKNELPKVQGTLNTIAVDLTPVLKGGENGGAKVFVLELLRMLAVMKPKTKFILLTRQSAYKELAFLDCPNMQRVVALDDSLAENTGKWGKKSVKMLIKKILTPDKETLRQMGVDLLFCPFTSLHMAEPGIPTVSTFYDLQYKTYPDFFDPKEVAHRNQVFMNACSHATLITAISEYTRQSAIAHGNLDPARIRTIYLRMANRFLSGSNSDIKPDNTILVRIGLTSQNYMLYPANFWKHKNHDRLLIAFYRACSNGLPPEMKLVCTGTPTDNQRFMIGMVHSLGLENRVIFPGYLSNNELSILLSNCIGLIFPSLYEGFGLPIIEAMSAGIPVACSNTRSLPEVSAGASLTFDPENVEEIAKSMVLLASDETLRRRLVKSGLKRAKEFLDQERMAKEYWLLFEDAITKHQQESIWVNWKEQDERSARKDFGLKFSIVTPSFNQGQFIERTLLSVQKQKGAVIEHIVFDGGSTDSTIEVLQRYSPSVKWVSEKDRGQADAVNKGIRAADGDIIGWLNSDDIYYPDAILHVSTFFDAHPDIDIVYGMADHIDIYDRPFESYPTEPWNYMRLYDTCFICQPALFFRRRVVEQHGMLDDSLHYCMDYEYWLRLGLAGVRFAYIEKKLSGSRLYAENKTMGSRVKVHREINDMFNIRFGKVPKRWLQNYAHITMHDRWKGRGTSRTEFDIRYLFAKLRWNFPL